MKDWNRFHTHLEFSLAATLPTGGDHVATARTDGDRVPGTKTVFIGNLEINDRAKRIRHLVLGFCHLSFAVLPLPVMLACRPAIGYSRLQLLTDRNETAGLLIVRRHQ
jgi:hypothetical protein